MSKHQLPRTPEDFDRLRRFLDLHAEHTWAEEFTAALHTDALHLIARGAPHPEAIAQAALGARALDQREITT